MTALDKCIVVVRHNTTLEGDFRLAEREMNSLLGDIGRRLVGREELISELDGSAVAHIPELPKEGPFVALCWYEIDLSHVIRLLKRSAFAQEVFIPNASVAADIEKQCGPVATDFVDMHSAEVTVAVSANYVVESEGVLTEQITSGRIPRSCDLLLEPYRYKGSIASRKLRSAKKTTLSLSHDLHIYKAKFFPRMIRALLNLYGKEGQAVVDPFCGSGTALLEASLLGFDAGGSDIDPICTLISQTKVAPFLDGRALLGVLDEFETLLQTPAVHCGSFALPVELAAKIARRDRIDGTSFLDEIQADARIAANALTRVKATGVHRDLLSVLVSDAVTKKVRYRFIGVGNGRYTIEIVKQSIRERLLEKVHRCRELVHVFAELQGTLRLELGNVNATSGDARDRASWPSTENIGLILTSPPYLPASSGREHYAASRSLAFAVLGFGEGKFGYHNVSNDNSSSGLSELSLPAEASRLMSYLNSDASEHADPQKDAMRFLRKAIPTREYLEDIWHFLAEADAGLSQDGTLVMIVASEHVFYSHRRQELEHTVSCKALYGELAHLAGLALTEEIPMELLKSSASRAKPRAKDDYYESILVIQPFDSVVGSVRSVA